MLFAPELEMLSIVTRYAVTVGATPNAELLYETSGAAEYELTANAWPPVPATDSMLAVTKPAPIPALNKRRNDLDEAFIACPSL
jgi:hypothetical protein